mgnify:CR=1 FL=1
MNAAERRTKITELLAASDRPMSATALAARCGVSRQIIVGDMPVGDLTAFTTYIVQILMSLMMVGMIMIQGSRALASSKRIKEVLTTEIDLNDNEAKCKDKEVENGAIEFRNVGFRYYKKN